MSEARDADTTEYEAKALVSTELYPPAPIPVRVEFAALTDPGKVRANNEDHYLVCRIGQTYRALDTNIPDGELPGPVDDEAYAMVVADGMGGMAAGERASR